MTPQLQMVDLLGQHAEIRSQVETYFQEILETAAYINGPMVGAFAKELSNWLEGVQVIPCANGTDALQLCLMALWDEWGLQAGDEVILPAFTYVATAEVLALLGLKPRFVDVSPYTYLLDPQQVERAVGPRTKAIMPVHLFGQAAPMQQLLELAEAYKLAVVEDNAQAIGCRVAHRPDTWGYSGTVAHVGAQSFYPSKNLGAYGDAGAVFTRDEERAARLRQLANHGQRERYYHHRVGVNSRLDSLQAAVLRAKLPHLERYNQNRQTAAAYYDSAFADHPLLTLPMRSPQSTHVFHQYTLRVAGGKREQLRQHLSQAQVPHSVFYPLPLHLQPAYQSPEQPEGSLPVSEQLSREVISLPMHSELTPEQLAYICEQVWAGLKG